MQRTLLLAVALAGMACVWAPADQSTQSRFASVPTSGWAQSPNAEIRVYLFNHETGVDDEVALTLSDTTPIFAEPHLYSWNAGWHVFPQKYWYPPAAGCSTGMLRMRVTENGARIKTFTDAQRDCILDEVDGGPPGQRRVRLRLRRADRDLLAERLLSSGLVNADLQAARDVVVADPRSEGLPQGPRRKLGVDLRQDPRVRVLRQGQMRG